MASASRRDALFIASCVLLATALPAQAEIVASNAGGFASCNSAFVAATPNEVWEALVHPEGWWTHSWSGDAANLSLDPRAGGCFCETLPAGSGGTSAQGSAEHMRVVMVRPGAMLRMAGALGPLQSEGLAGTLTVTLAEEAGGTRITWDFITGGQARFDLAQIAPMVDDVQRQFLDALVKKLGGAAG